jgi:hypothetical protein
MNTYDDTLLSTIALSVKDVSFGIILVLCACILMMPLALLVGLLYSGIRDRKLTSANEATPTEHPVADRNDQPSPGETP